MEFDDIEQARTTDTASVPSPPVAALCVGFAADCPLSTPCPASTPRSVNVTFVNYTGQRSTLPGRVGQSLLELADSHGYNWVDGACGGAGASVEKDHVTGWTEPKYGEGEEAAFGVVHDTECCGM